MHLPRSQKAVELLNQLSAARVLDEDTSRIDIVSHSEDVDVSPAASFVVVPDSENWYISLVNAYSSVCNSRLVTPYRSS